MVEILLKIDWGRCAIKSRRPPSVLCNVIRNARGG